MFNSINEHEISDEKIISDQRIIRLKHGLIGKISIGENGERISVTLLHRLQQFGNFDR